MIGVRIAVQTKCLAQPLKQSLLTAARVQCDGVQFDAREELPARELSDTGLRQLRKMLNDLNLRAGSIYFPTRRGYGNPQDLERRLEAANEAMRLAARLQARVLVLTMGPLPDEPSSERATLIEAVESLAAQASRVGVQIALQSPAAAADLAALLDKLPEGLVGVDLDPAAIIRNGGRPAEFAATLGKRVTHVFANDATPTARGAADGAVQLGRGTAEFPELLAALEEFGYRGWATITTHHSAQPADDAADAVRFLRSL